MSRKRYFLGWDRPLTAAMVDVLLPADTAGPVDLGDTLIVVPTRQAGRRLREALALACAERDTAILAARVVTPAFLLQPDGTVDNIANPSTLKAAWQAVLRRVETDRFPALFPHAPAARDASWCFQTAELLQGLRETLADGGYRIADVPQACGRDLPEPERWNDLGRLEKLFLRELDELGKTDPCIAKIARSASPEPPEGMRRIVVAAVPDPPRLAVKAMKTLAGAYAVEIYVHAPASLDALFDGWGRPLPDRWAEREIAIPDEAETILLAGSPNDQARRVLQAIAAMPAEMGPGDAAVGVPDPTLAPVLTAALEQAGLSVFDPANLRMRDHPLYGLLDAAIGLALDPAYSQFSGLLRHPAVLAHLQTTNGLEPAAVLAQLDAFQNEYLPAGLGDFVKRFPTPDAYDPLKPAIDNGYDPGRTYGALAPAVAFADWTRSTLSAGDGDDGLRAFLQTVYHHRRVDTSLALDREFETAAACVDDALREIGEGRPAGLHLRTGDRLELVRRRVAAAEYAPERTTAPLDIEGWLELPWNDAPCLVVTGMNEGFVPDSRPADVFLPNAMRTTLGLRDDKSRFARDAYIMQGLVASRSGGGGRARFIVGKTNAAGDPLKPSRLLFLCKDEVLPERAARLFAAVPETRPHHPSTVSFKLDPWACPVDPRRLPVQRLSVTAFRDYLACPLRFYLKHVLRMEEAADDKIGLDALDFGSMVHGILENAADDPDMVNCTDAERLSGRLGQAAEAWVRDRFGASPSLPIQISLHAAQQRLGAAARQLAAQARDGWEAVQSETAFEREIGGVLVKGKIDRVERNRHTGETRIVDFKTADKAVDPLQAHLGTERDATPAFARVTVGRNRKRWLDLQLPLYLVLMSEGGVPDPRVGLAYFNLPRALVDTGLQPWQGLTGDVLDSAIACAEAVIAKITDGVFWPPAERVAPDDFAHLFPAEAVDCIREPAS